MNKCAFCGKKIIELPFHCRRCNGNFCQEHRLPEDHMCSGIYHRFKVKKSSPEVLPESEPVSKYTKKQPIDLELKPTIKSSEQTNNLKENIPRQKLCEILKGYNTAILKDSKRLKAILNDLCKGQHSREINAIVTVLDEHIPQNMIKSKDKIPYPILSENLQKKLKDNTYLSEDLIIWTVDSWASALGIIHDP